MINYGRGCGGRIRTDDLRVMSPTSYHCSTPPAIVANPRGLGGLMSGRLAVTQWFRIKNRHPGAGSGQAPSVSAERRTGR